LRFHPRSSGDGHVNANVLAELRDWSLANTDQQTTKQLLDRHSHHPPP
jgi:hypothetical protein